MNISEPSTNEIQPHRDQNIKMRFIKNKKGERVEGSLEGFVVKKNIDIMVGNNNHTRSEIIKALKESNFQNEVIFVVSKKS